MERIDYDSYTRRARELRTRAIADFGRGIVAALATAYRCARRTFAEQLNRQVAASGNC